MAIFNPLAPEVQIQDQTGASRGIPDDQSFRTLFSGIGNIAEGWVNYRDEEIQRQIYEDTRAQTDQIQKPYIDALGGSPAPAGGPTGPVSGSPVNGDSQSGFAGGRVDFAALPPGLKSAHSDMGKLVAQLNAGVIREADYDLKLFSMLKGLRSRYPGYNRQIDSIVGSVTGVQPGNALVSDFFQEARAATAAANAEQNRKLSWVANNQADVIIAVPNFFENQDQWLNDPVKYAHLQSMVSGIQATDANRKRVKDQMELDRAMGIDVSLPDRAFTLGMQTASDMANQVINGALQADGSLMQSLQRAAQGGQIDPAMIEQMNSSAAELLIKQQQAVEAMLNAPMNERGDTLASTIGDDAQLNLIRKQAIAPIQNIIDNINNGDYGLAAMNANFAKHLLDADKRVMLEQFDVFRQIQTLQAIGGDMAVQSALAGPGPMADDFSEATRQSGQVLSAGGGKNVNEFFQIVKPGIVSGALQKNLVITNIDDAIRQATAPNMLPEIRANAIKYLYGDPTTDFLNNFPLEEQATIYNRMTNPSVSKQIFAASQDNPELWKAYTDWSVRNFVPIFKNRVDDIQIGVQHRKWLSIGWNPETFQFRVDALPGNPISEAFGKGPGAGGFVGTIGSVLSLTPADAVEGLLSATSINAIKDVNLALKSIQPIIEMNGGDPNVEMLVLLQTMGVNLQAPKQGPFLDGLAQAIQGFQDYIINNAGTKYGNPISGPRE